MSKFSKTPTLETQRLLLRSWREEDLEPFAKMNADPEVMRHFPAPLSRVESNRLAERIQQGFSDNGFGLWAVGLKSGASFIGFIGLAVPKFQAHFTPCVEIGWRLAAEHWGQGLAPEGAIAALECGFRQLEEIVSITAVQNVPSRRVMEKIGMTHDSNEDFDHPSLPKGDRLERHVLYRARRESWRSDGGTAVG